MSREQFRLGARVLAGALYFIARKARHPIGKQFISLTRPVLDTYIPSRSFYYPVSVVESSVLLRSMPSASLLRRGHPGESSSCAWHRTLLRAPPSCCSSPLPAPPPRAPRIHSGAASKILRLPRTPASGGIG